jgi:hypothetical protein
MNINDFFQKYESFVNGKKENYPAIVCKDGLILSVQASRSHYSFPKEDVGPYTHVEVGYPSKDIDELTHWEEQDSTGIYLYVPVEVVEKVIEDHGGFAGIYIDRVVQEEE